MGKTDKKTKKKRTTTKADVEIENNVEVQEQVVVNEETDIKVDEDVVVETKDEPAENEIQQVDATYENLEAKKEIHEDILFKIDNKDTAELLNYLQTNTFPDINVGGIWTRAIAKVQKRDMSVSWCVIKRTSLTETAIEKVCGRCSPIAKIGKQFPVEALPFSFIEEITSQGKSYAIKVIAQHNKNFDKSKFYTEEQISDALTDILIKEHWNNGKRNK